MFHPAHAKHFPRRTALSKVSILTLKSTFLVNSSARSSRLSRSSPRICLSWRAILCFISSAALAWAESFRRLSSQPSQKPRRFWRPGFSNSSSRSWARRRLHVGGLALPQVCLTCFPPHAAQPSLPPPGGLLVEDSNTDIVNCDNILRRYYSRYIDTAEKQIKNKKIKWRPSIGWVFTVG